MFFSQLKKNLLIYRYFYLVVVFFVCTNSYSQSITQLQKKADDLFDKQNYSAALIDFRQLLAQNPTSIQFNYKYGVCLFYSDNRKNAKRYFDFVLRQNAFPSETYYYLAKLCHFDYKFSSAIDYYQKYWDNTPEKLRNKDVAIYIKQCENGKLLLKNPKALNIIMANRFSMSKFYNNYELQSRTGGFFTDEALQSKIDKKNNFIPMYYFARGDSIKFFASYGTTNTTANNKDIYFSRKISADLWTPATKILGEINTPLDEDYPFFDAQKGILFFSSMGHNSIGGYDLFQVKFNPLENNTQSITNLDFPYSSADDDFLFVPEVNQKTAYFASNRNCEVNKIDVYAVEFGTKKSTIQLIKGDFYDLVDDKNKLAQIMVVDMNSAIEYGPFTTDENGKYVIVIPGSGKYKFSVTVDGSRQLFENIADVPEVKDNKRLSQTLRYSVEESKEIVVFDNYFSNQELASEEDKLLLISAIASLKMNPTLIKNTPLENNLSNELSAILSDLGYNSPLVSDAIEKLHDDIIQVEIREEELITDINRAILLQDENSETMDLLSVKRNVLDEAIKDTDLTPEVQLDLFSKLAAVHEEEMALKQQKIALQELIEQKQNEISMVQREDLTKSATVLNEKLLMLSLQNNDDSTKLFLTQNKDLIQTLLAKAPITPNVDELLVLQQNLANITQLRQNKENDLISFVDSLYTVIDVLKTEKLSANNKDKASIEKQIIAEEKKLFDQKTENKIAINSLFQEEQKLKVDLLKIELNQDLIASEVNVSTKSLNKASIDNKKVSVDDILDSYDEKLKVENSIAQITKNENQRGELNAKLATLTQQNDSKEKFDELLALSSKIESLINLDISKAEEKNDFLSANKYNEELQLLKNQQEKYKSELIRIDGSSAKDVQKAKQEDEDIVEQKKTEELAAQAEQKAKQEAEGIAEQKKTEELAAQAEQKAKQEAESIAEQKKTEELAQAEQKAKQEAESIAEQKKTDELAAQAEQKSKQEAESIAEQKKTEELAAQAEQMAKQEAESIAEQKKTEELAQVEQRAKQEAEGIAEQKKTEELAAQAEQKAKQEAESIAEQKKTEELAQAEQKEKQEAESIAEQKKTEELAAQAEQKAKQEAEDIVEQKKTEELAAQAEQRAKQEAESIVEQKKTEELAAQAEQRAKQEAESIAEQKKTEEIAAQVEQKAKQEAEGIAEQKKTEELAAQAEQRAKQETEGNTEQITKINVDENTPYSVAIREQLKQLNSESSEDLLTSFDETKKLEQGILSNTDPIAKEKEINVLKVLNESNELIASQIILAAKIKVLEVDYPTLKELNNNNIEIANTLRIQKEVLEDLKKKESVEKVKLIDRDIAIITTQINAISSQSESSQLPTPLIFNNNEQLTTTEKEEISKDAAYYEYLQKRTAYNQTVVSRDSLQDKIYSEKQKLDFLLQQDNRDVSPSKSELELAKLLSEQLLLLNELSVKLEMQGKAITNTANQAKMETMLLEKIQPIQIIAASAKAVTYDFTIGKEVYPVDTKLPVLSSSPSGLVFRVQVGAFRKPVAVDKFREFSPVSGEILTNGLTVYLAGYFNNTDSALTARKEIRKIGYADAFVVAYCDGKRISIAEARALEQSGRCVPKSQIELSNEVAKLFETIDIIPDVNLAVEKEQIFYTVQVGVYNKKINLEQLPGIEELEAFQSPNGKYRYSSGKFLSLDDAKIRKADIVTKGITDAYIVAYRNGNRIDLNLAKVLIEQKVKSANIEPLLTERQVPIDFNKLTTKNEPIIDYVQFSKMISNTMPSDLLGIANKGGTFVFDPIQNSILSGYINLNSISAFERIYYADMTIVEKTNSTKVCSIFIEESTIKSALHDWLLHCNIPYTIISNSNSFEIQFVLLQNDLIENIEQMASKYDYVVKINEL